MDEFHNNIKLKAQKKTTQSSTGDKHWRLSVECYKKCTDRLQFGLIQSHAILKESAANII